MTPEPARVVIVAAQNEASRIGAALDALAGALPGARLMVADDASSDGTQQEAMRHGAWLVSRRRPHGKGGNVTAAAEAAIGEFGDSDAVLLCDADLGETAGELVALVRAVETGRCDLAIGGFAQPGPAASASPCATHAGPSSGSAARGSRRRSPGQRAMRVSTLRQLIPFAAGWGLEVGMTIDAIRSGLRVEELSLPLRHRATGTNPRGVPAPSTAAPRHPARRARPIASRWMILAIDQGTTGSTCIVFDDEGRPRGRSYSEFEQHFPKPGWVEHDASEIWEVTRRVAIGALADAAVQASDLKAIGITNQRETVVAWDRETGEPVHRALVWQDRRTAARCDELREEGHEALIRERTGLVIDPYFSGTKIEWLIKNADLRARTLAFGTIDSWLVFKLTGRHLTDYSNASRTMLFDIRKRSWDDELCAPAGRRPEVPARAGARPR